MRYLGVGCDQIAVHVRADGWSYSEYAPGHRSGQPADQFGEADGPAAGAFAVKSVDVLAEQNKLSGACRDQLAGFDFDLGEGGARIRPPRV